MTFSFKHPKSITYHGKEENAKTMKKVAINWNDLSSVLAIASNTFILVTREKKTTARIFCKKFVIAFNCNQNFHYLSKF